MSYMKTDEEYFAVFEKLGEPAVAAKIAHGFSGKRLRLASSWMNTKNNERSLEDTKAASEANANAREVNNLTKTCNKIARYALAFTMLAAIIFANYLFATNIFSG